MKRNCSLLAIAASMSLLFGAGIPSASAGEQKLYVCKPDAPFVGPNPQGFVRCFYQTGPKGGVEPDEFGVEVAGKSALFYIGKKEVRDCRHVPIPRGAQVIHVPDCPGDRI